MQRRLNLWVLTFSIMSAFWRLEFRGEFYAPLLYLKCCYLPDKKHFASIESKKALQLFRKVINIYSVDSTKSLNNLCGKTKFPKVTAGGTYHQWTIEY